jgi:hypothetical protein
MNVMEECSDFKERQNMKSGGKYRRDIHHFGNRLAKLQERVP